jgi:hypothetical protein
MASIQRCANIHLVLEYMCVYTSIYPHALCCCEQDTVVIVPPYQYGIKEDRLDVALDDCWYARPQLFYKFYLRPKHGRLPRNGTYKAGPGIYKYIRLYTCMYLMICCLPDDLLRELDFGRGKPRLGGLSVEATEERRHAHMAEGHKRRVETRRRHKADRT